MPYDRDQIREVREKISEQFARDNEFKKKKEIQEVVRKAMLSCIIYPLDQMEKNFGELWGENLPDGAELSDEQSKYDELYEKVRKNILDFGNKLIRDVLKKLDTCRISDQKIIIKLKDVRNEK